MYVDFVAFESCLTMFGSCTSKVFFLVNEVKSSWISWIELGCYFLLIFNIFHVVILSKL